MLETAAGNSSVCHSAHPCSNICHAEQALVHLSIAVQLILQLLGLP